MRHSFFVLICIAVVLALNTPARAQRTDIYDSTAQPLRARIAVLKANDDDGGCRITTVCAQISSNDGGSTIQSCEGVDRELRPGGGLGACLTILDGAGKVWLNRQSISSADSGVPDAGF